MKKPPDTLNKEDLNSIKSLLRQEEEPELSVEDEITALEERHGNREFFSEGGLKRIEAVDDYATGRLVAFATPKNMSDSVIRERFLREARVLASLQHPNIVPILI